MATDDWEILDDQPLTSAPPTQTTPTAAAPDWEVLGEEDVTPEALMDPGEALSVASIPEDQANLGTRQQMASALTLAGSDVVEDVARRDIQPVPYQPAEPIQSTALTATRRALPGGTTIPEPADPDADLRAMRRLPSNIAKSTKAQIKQSIAGTQRLFADLQTNMDLAKAQAYRAYQSDRPDVQAQQEAAAQQAEERAGQAELAQGRARRATTGAAQEAQAAVPADAGPIEQAIQSGLSSAAVTIPIVTLGSVVPGGQGAALVTLGGMTGTQRYGELRAAGMDEGTAALSGAALGGLEALTEKIPLGTLAKKSPLVERAVEFLVQDLLGENVSSLAQLADDYRLQLRDDVTVEDIKQTLADTTAATVVGAGAQLTVSGLLEQVLAGANQKAQARTADTRARAGMQRQEPTISEPTLRESSTSLTSLTSPPSAPSETDTADLQKSNTQAEQAALEAVRTGSATPEQEAIVESAGHLVRGETGKPMLLPSGRRRLTELKGSTRVENDQPSGKEGAPNLAQQGGSGQRTGESRETTQQVRAPVGRAGAGDLHAGSGQTESAQAAASAGTSRAPRAASATQSQGTATDDVKSTIPIPEQSAQVELADLQAVLNETATVGQVELLASKGYARQRRDMTGTLLPAGRRRMHELLRGEPAADVEATFEGEELRRAGNEIRPAARVTVEPAQPRGRGPKLAGGGFTVHLDGKPIIELPDAETARQAAAGLEADGSFQTTVANQTVTVNIAPSDAQKAAGNYRKGHIAYAGLDISIENPAGSIRSGVGQSGRKWSRALRADYGYVKGSESADGDHVDVFLGGDGEAQQAYVIDQLKPDGTFDEHKVMLRYPSQQAAEKAYLENYPKGWKGLGAITAVPLEKFNTWVKSARAKRPYAWKPSGQENTEVPATTKGLPATEPAKLHKKAPAGIKALRRKVDTLERQVDAAFERGDTDRAEDLDAQLATLRERLTSSSAAIEEDEESFDSEAGLEEQLVNAYHSYLQMERTGKPFGAFNEPGDALANMRDAIASERGKPGTDEEILAAAKDAYDTASQRRNRRAAKLHKKQTETAAFRKWFGDSQVVDENGEPLVVYHGTNQSFDDFSKERLGMATKMPSATAFFFTNSSDEATLYAEAAARKVVADIDAHEKKVAKLQADIAKAERAKDWTRYESLMEQWEATEINASRDDVSGANVIPVYLSMQNPLVVEVNGLISAGPIRDHIEQARKSGNDGVIFKGIEDSPKLGSPATDQYVVFAPTQIKSAIGNRGTFDPKDADIRMHRTEDAYRKIVGALESKHVAAVRSEVERIARVFAGADARVFATVNELPGDVRARFIAGGGIDADGKVQVDAFYDPSTGQVIFIANEIASIEDIEPFFMHEHVAHGGLASMLSSQKRDEILNGIVRDLPDLVRAKAKDYGLNYALLADRQLAAEEVIAEMAEIHLTGRALPSKQKSILDRIIQAIADVLRKLGMRKYDEKFIAALLTDLHRHARQGGTDETTQLYRARRSTNSAMPDWDESQATEVAPDFADYLQRARMHLANGDEEAIYSYALKQYDQRQQLWQWEGIFEDAHVLVRGTEAGGYDLYIDDELILPPDESGNFPSMRLAQAAAREYLAERGVISDSDADRILNAMPITDDLRLKFHRKPFFSALQSKLNGLKLQKATGAQWKGTITNMPGISREEIEWTGIKEWLDEQKGTITKDQVLEYARANDIQIQEVLKGETEKEESRRNELQIKIDNARVNLDALGFDVVDFDEGGGDTGILALMERRSAQEYEIETSTGDYQWVNKNGNTPPGEVHEIAYTMHENMQALASLGAEDSPSQGTPRYEDWTLPGSNNYRELLLTLPADVGNPKYEALSRQADDLRTRKLGEILEDGRSVQAALDEVHQKQEAIKASAYISSHWSEPNILAHIRFDERTDADGKRVLFIEEIQSDWHQYGRKHGYASSGDSVEFQRLEGELEKARQALGVEQRRLLRQSFGVGSYTEILNDAEKKNRFKEAQRSDEAWMQANARVEEINRQRHAVNPASKAPEAPFKTSWPELAFKRMLKWAVDENFDRVAWTTGAQQNERYNLSQVVRRVEWIAHPNRPDTSHKIVQLETTRGLGKMTIDEAGIVIDTSSGFVFDNIDVQGHPVSEIIGDALAKQILAEPSGDLDQQQIDKIVLGGEGMRAFYDRMLPAAVSKLTKKWGGKVGTTKIDVEGFDRFFDLIEAGNKWRLVHKIDGNTRLDANGQPLDPVARAPLFSSGEAAKRWIMEHGLTAAEVHSLDVTDKMRDAVSGGLPKFHRKSMVGVFRRRQAVQNGTFDLVEGSRTSRWWNLLVFKAQDRFYDLFRLQEQAKIFRQAAQIPDSMDAYLKETLYHGRVEERVSDYDKQYVEPLVQMIKGSGYTWQQVEDYLYARHAPEANARLVAINGGNAAFHSGMTDAEATQVMATLAAAGDIRKLDAIGAHVDAMTQWERTTLVMEGLEDQATVQEWENTYDHYIPLKGWAHNPELAEMPRRGRGFDTGGRTTKDRTGRTSRAGNILANIVAQAQIAVIRAEKARVGRSLLEFVKANPAPRLYEVNTIEYHRYIDKGTGLVTQGINPQFRLSKNVVRVRVNGKDEHIVFNPNDPQMQRLASAMKNLSATEMGLILTFLHGINRYLSTINTSLNPEFVVSNALRDLQTAAVNLQSTDLQGRAMGIMKDWRQAWTAIRQSEAGNTSHAWAPWWDRFKKSGAKVGWIQHYTSPVDIEKKLQKDMNRHGVVGNLAKGIEGALGWIERQNLAVENALRLATFRAGVESGLSDERAAQIAKNLTVNFNKRGDLGVALNSFILFYNAGVQGTATILRAAQSPRARKFMYGIVAAGVALDIINRWIGGEDDDEENRYDKIRGYEKERNIILMLPKERRFKLPSGDEIDHIKIPMPYGYNFLYYTGTKMGGLIDYAMGNKRRLELTQDAAQLAGAFLGAFNPLGGNSNPLESITAVEPYIQLTEERTWDGRPMMPPQPQYDIPLPDSQRYWKSASKGAREVTDWMNRATGGTEITPGAIDVSPATVDYWMDFALGGTGRFLSNTVNTAHDITLDRKDLELGEVPFVRRVLGQTGERDRQERFYNRINDVNYVIKERETAMEMRRFTSSESEQQPYRERIDYIEKKYPIASKLEREGRRAEARMKQLRSARRALQSQEGRMQESKRLERLEGIETQIRSVMDEFNRAWNHAEDAQRSPTDTKDLIGELAPLIGNKTRAEAIRALRENGKPATAELLASLPLQLREELRKNLEKELAS